MPRRSGATLIEVLVAIFIMGIGLMALLTLFPLGALRMAKAIQDDRCSQAAVTAGNIASLGSVRSDASVQAAMLNGTTGLLQPNPELKSYPVYIDPVGLRTMAGLPNSNIVAGSPLLPRVAPSFAPVINAQAIMQFFALPDDLMFDNVNFSNFGYPKTLLPGLVERDTRYTWAFLAQRPRCADAAVVDLSVIVYSSRSLALTGNLALPEVNFELYDPKQPVGEVAYDLTRNVVRVRWDYFSQLLGVQILPPQVRSGDWVLDLSNVSYSASATNDVHAYFYRVAGVAEGLEELPAGSGKFYQYTELETQQPLRGFPAAWTKFDGPPTSGNINDRARLLTLEGVAEVFERSVGKTP